MDLNTLGPPHHLRRSRSICVTKYVRQNQCRRTSLCANFAVRNSSVNQPIEENEPTTNAIPVQVRQNLD